MVCSVNTVTRACCAIALLLCTGAFAHAGEAGSALPDKVTDDPLLNSRFLMFGPNTLRRQTLRWAARRRATEMVPAMIYALRFLRPAQREEVVAALETITRRRYGDDWFRWVQWQQANPQIKPFANFALFQAAVLGALDAGFRDFIYPGVAHRIRLEEVLWGGVRAKDGIPALINPSMIAATDAHYLGDDEQVFGAVVGDQARAYPYRIMDWHEMVNDTIAGQPVALAYCTLCGSGILFDTARTDTEPFLFGSSGLLYRSNKLMYDHATDSLWNQFTGEPVVGTLTQSAIKLPVLPLVSTTWGEWRKRNPHTRVLDPATGYERNYAKGEPYADYFRSGKLMFPADTSDRQLQQKAKIFALRVAGVERAWPLNDFKNGAVLNETVGVLKFVLIGDADTQSVRAYRRGDVEFTRLGKTLEVVIGDGVHWQVTEAGLIANDGRRFSRLPGHLAYWFAWHNYFDGASLRGVP